MTSETNPLVTVIIPAYNMAELTALTVDSVLNQTYQPIEIIVVDDGSKDHTQQRLAAFTNRITYIHKENGGACSARNVGLRRAKGEFIGLIDCDDLYRPEKIERGINFFRKNPDYGMLHTAYELIDGKGKIIDTCYCEERKPSGFIKERLILKNFINNATVMVRRECFNKAGFYDESMFPPADWDMWLRIAQHYRVGYLNEPLSRYRVSSQGCLNRLEQPHREALTVIDKFCQRNPEISPLIKNRAYANAHLRMAMYLFLKNDKKPMKEEFQKAWKQEPANPKAWGLLLLYLFANPYLRKTLKRKIEYVY